MQKNTLNNIGNHWRLPTVGIDIAKILEDTDFSNFKYLKWQERIAIQEIIPIYTQFVQRVKKILKGNWDTETAQQLAQEFVLNYESIRLYFENTETGNGDDWGRFANYWDSNSIQRYFTDNKWIANELSITEDEVWEYFGKGVKLRLAVKNISDPIGALRRVKKHLDNTLSDTNIATGLSITEYEVRENFGKRVKLHFAVSSISDPIGALRRVKEHLDNTLSDTNIANELSITEDEVRENFGKNVKLHFAVNNISDPIDWCRKWKIWDIKIPWWVYKIPNQPH
jgi:hypothetical protein